MVLCLSGTYNELLDYVIFAALVFYFLTTLALFRLRRLRPDLPRPVKAFGYPVLPALYMRRSRPFCWWSCCSTRSSGCTPALGC